MKYLNCLKDTTLNFSLTMKLILLGLSTKKLHLFSYEFFISDVELIYRIRNLSPA